MPATGAHAIYRKSTARLPQCWALGGRVGCFRLSATGEAHRDVKGAQHERTAASMESHRVRAILGWDGANAQLAKRCLGAESMAGEKTSGPVAKPLPRTCPWKCPRSCTHLGDHGAGRRNVAAGPASHDASLRGDDSRSPTLEPVGRRGAQVRLSGSVQVGPGDPRSLRRIAGALFRLEGESEDAHLSRGRVTVETSGVQVVHWKTRNGCPRAVRKLLLNEKADLTGARRPAHGHAVARRVGNDLEIRGHARGGYRHERPAEAERKEGETGAKQIQRGHESWQVVEGWSWYEETAQASPESRSDPHPGTVPGTDAKPGVGICCQD